MFTSVAQARSESDLLDGVSVFQAQRLLDESTWSQTIRIQNRRPNSVFKATVWALAFEFGGRIWVYMPQVGSQTPTVKIGQLETDKVDLNIVLKRINKGFGSYEVMSANATIIAGVEQGRDVPNACLLESLAALRKMVRSGVALNQAKLLMYYANVGSSLVGHTVLFFETDEGRFVWDPVAPEKTISLRKDYKSNALALARVVAETGVRAKVAMAHLLSIAESDRGGSPVADLARRDYAKLVN
jgi:hypothetical protein